jgi:hypothetical protein
MTLVVLATFGRLPDDSKLPPHYSKKNRLIYSGRAAGVFPLAFTSIEIPVIDFCVSYRASTIAVRRASHERASFIVDMPMENM